MDEKRFVGWMLSNTIGCSWMVGLELWNLGENVLNCAVRVG